MKIIAAFDVDEAKLKEIENGDPQNAFGWLEDSGLYLKQYTEFTDEERLPSIENLHKISGPHSYRAMQIPLHNDRYVLEAESYSDGDVQEISIVLFDTKEKCYVQDICIIRPSYTWTKDGEMDFHNGTDVLVWNDPEDEDYTHKFHVGISESYEKEMNPENTTPILKM